MSILPATPPPSAQLARLVTAKATGEFIVAGGEAEMHVYLQGGRIAWGTTTSERFVFRRYLLETLKVDADALQVVFEECRRSRQPLGEALVSWRLLTREQVRDALRAQVTATLAAIDACLMAQTLFLPRGQAFASYDPALTFELEEFQPAPVAPAVESLADEALARVLAAVPAAPWAAVLEGRRVLRSVREVPPGPLEALAVRVGVDRPLVAVRSSSGSVLGGVLPQVGHSVWCGLPGELGLSAALGAMTGLVPALAVQPLGCAKGPFESFGEAACDVSGIDELLEQAQCPVGAVVLEGTAGAQVWATARESVDACELGREAARHQAILELDVFGTRARRGPSRPELAFQTALVGDARWWWFGAELATAAQASVWLALPRAVSSGLGWALLATLARKLSAEGGARG